MPFKTPPVAIKRILWTCLVISWSQAPLSRSKAKSDGFTLYLSVSQIALSSCLRPFSSKWLLRLSRSPMASSQLAKLSPTFRPNPLVYIPLPFEITGFNQQQSMKVWMCHHVPIIPLVTSVVLKKPATPDLNRLV